MAAVHVTLNLFQGPDPAGWMLKPVQHDVIPAELNSFVLSPQFVGSPGNSVAGRTYGAILLRFSGVSGFEGWTTGLCFESEALSQPGNPETAGHTDYRSNGITGRQIASPFSRYLQVIHGLQLAHDADCPE